MGKAQLTHLIYGLGASIVILGALFKILHWELGPLNGSVLLAIGLITEALIFAYSALFDQPQGEAVAEKKPVADNATVALSAKIDDMLKAANIDQKLLQRFGDSIRTLESSAQSLTPSADAMSNAKKYGEQLAAATAQMETINGLYRQIVATANNQPELNKQLGDNTNDLKAQMEALSSNMTSLNNVYGAMLSAMNKTK